MPIISVLLPLKRNNSCFLDLKRYIMRPIKFTEENIKRVFKSFAVFDGFELEICQPDEVYPRLHARFNCCAFSKRLGSRTTIGCGIIHNIPSNWYWSFGVDTYGAPFILFDGSYTV